MLRLILTGPQPSLETHGGSFLRCLKRTVMPA